MEQMAIAIQQPAMQENAAQQGLNGVVNNAGEEKSFGKVLKALIKEANQPSGQKALQQLLKENGDKNAQEMAAQLMAQNPLLLAMLLGNIDASGAGIEAVMSQLTQSAQPIESASAALQELMPLINAQTQPATEQPVISNAFSTAVLQALQQQAASQTQKPQQTAAQDAAQDAAVMPQSTQQDGLLQQLNAAGAQVVTPQPAQQKQQPQQLAEKADFEAIAQKIKLETAKAQQGEAQQQSTESGGGENKQVKEQKLTDSGVKPGEEQAVQANFEKQLTSASPVLKNEIIVKNQGSQEIVRQTVEGIKQNIASGKEEFVMKLSPEGLGEITVKLVSENGHTTLQLTAQSQSIQRILGAELEALKQAVRPYNVEVKEVNTADQSQLDMNMSNQNSSQQQYQSSAANFFYNQQQGKGQYTYQSYLSGAETQDMADDDSSVIAQTIIQSTAINLHI